MMTLRSRIFIIASIVVLVILAISISLYIFGKKEGPASDETAEPTATGQVDEDNIPEAITAPPPTVIPASPTVKPLSSEDVLKNAAKQLAKIFIERYGTYSSENNGENIKECESLVTEDLYAEISKRIGVQPPNGEFTGATTKAIAVDLAEYSDTAAKAELGVNRIITKGDSIEEKPSRVNVWLTRSGDGWLVSKFEWLQ